MKTSKTIARPKIHKELRAEAFVLVDSEGRERAELKTIQTGNRSDTVFALYDEAGNLRLTLREGWKESGINIFSQIDGTAEEVVTIGYEPTPDNSFRPKVMIRDGRRREQIVLGVRADGEGQITCFGTEGAQAAMHAEGLTTWDANDRIVAEVGISEAANPSPLNPVAAPSSTNESARLAAGQVAELLVKLERALTTLSQITGICTLLQHATAGDEQASPQQRLANVLSALNTLGVLCSDLLDRAFGEIVETKISLRQYHEQAGEKGGAQ